MLFAAFMYLQFVFLCFGKRKIDEKGAHKKLLKLTRGAQKMRCCKGVGCRRVCGVRRETF